jgi:CDP-glucose 4,6-dehydratase
MRSFSNIYQGRKVFVTGHTGFKGGWLVTWLLKMGAKVVGLSNNVPTNPAMFDLLDLKSRIRHVIGDVRNLETVRTIIEDEAPDFVFHLAAQPIVSTSYTEPMETLSTNINGTINILEALRAVTHPCVSIFITSDKCYDNVEWVWGYKETDTLGGKDIYSGSKAAAEIVIKSYLQSFFKNGHYVRIGVGRAGNVIGGGDWAKDRIVADCMRAWSSEREVEIRCPTSTRPWQHVLEPISGYLTLGSQLVQSADYHGEAFNFGPVSEQNQTVIELLTDLANHWRGELRFGRGYKITDNIPFREAGLLKLNCDKASQCLRWQPNLCYAEMIRMVGEWYSEYYNHGGDMYCKTLMQIEEYEKIAEQRRRIWAK